MNFNKAPCGDCVYRDKVCPISQNCERYKKYNALRKARNRWLDKLKEKEDGKRIR
ncbi:MAG: hypothetical protein PHC62_03925 [Candidatus Izemoplasmatales bacterium]|nr:hypothetical protein [Candidatus Izemoplasmatales bacterium]